MISSEKTFKGKNCLEVIPDKVQKLLEQGFVKKYHQNKSIMKPQNGIFRYKQFSLLTEQPKSGSAEGRDGKSLNDHLEKGPNYINSLPNVFIAWRFDKEE